MKAKRHVVLYLGREQKTKQIMLEFDVDNSEHEENQARLRAGNSLFCNENVWQPNNRSTELQEVSICTLKTYLRIVG